LTKLFKLLYTVGLKVHVKCSQTGERLLVDITDLSNEEGDRVVESEVFPKAKVIVDCKGTPYPAEVIKLESNV